MPLLVATVFDAILQLLILRSVRMGHAVLTGCLLVGLPYALVRTITNRIVPRNFVGPPCREGPDAAG
jgi:ABC-type spermidine/putrescine transport system permease subunit I